MSNIFNLLGGIAESNESPTIKPIERSKTFQEIRLNSHKTMGGTKPKGLSLRSNSDMNVSHSSYPGSLKKSNKEQDFSSSKLKVTQIDSNGRPISPGKKLIAQPINQKGLSLKEETVIDKSVKTPKILNDGIFKKPLLPKKFVKKFPEPEKLADSYEDQYKFDYGHIETIEKEFKDFLKEKENIIPDEEIDLMLDSERLFVEIPKLILSKTFDQEYTKCSSPELPEISDDDNL